MTFVVTDLQDCPLCKKPAEFHADENGYSVDCPYCKTTTGKKETPEEAVSNWNSI